MATTYATNQFGKGDPAFLDTEPPHWAARGLAYLIIALFALAAIASVMIQLPETITAQFTLVPVRGTDPVKALRDGVVSEVRVKEGQAVAKGEVVVAIKSETAGDQSADLESFETQLAGTEGSLANARQRFEEQRAADEKEISKLGERAEHQARMIEFKKRQLAMAQGIADNYARLVKEGLASATEQTRRQLEINQIASEVEQAEADRRESLATAEKLRNEIKARQAEYRELERGLREEAAKNSIRVNALRDRVDRGRGNAVTMTAPCSGTILRLRVKGGGAVVREGDVLCELVCEGEMLQAEILIPESGVGRIREGQGVKLLYDAFPYQRFGVKRGTLRWLSPASLSAAFRALADVEDESVVVSGQPRRLMPGMGGRAEIVIGKRSIISYVFDPVRQLKESLSDGARASTEE
jgi:multidrug efflux pump subunit AcrA (membrane-fusion protein)